MPFYLQRNGIKVIHWFNDLWWFMYFLDASWSNGARPCLSFGSQAMRQPSARPGRCKNAMSYPSPLDNSGENQKNWGVRRKSTACQSYEDYIRASTSCRSCSLNEQIACFWDASGCLWVESSNVQRLLSPAQGQLLSSPTFSRCRMIFRHFARFCTVRSSTSDFRD